MEIFFLCCSVLSYLDPFKIKWHSLVYSQEEQHVLAFTNGSNEVKKDQEKSSFWWHLKGFHQWVSIAVPVSMANMKSLLPKLDLLTKRHLIRRPKHNALNSNLGKSIALINTWTTTMHITLPLVSFQFNIQYARISICQHTVLYKYLTVFLQHSTIRLCKLFYIHRHVHRQTD